MPISTLAYKLVADTRQFTTGMVASRKELNMAKRLMVETKPPAEKLEASIASLGGLLRKGAIDQKTYNRAVAGLKSEVKAVAGPLDRIGKQLIGMAAGYASVTVAIGLAKQAFFTAKRVFIDTVKTLDETVKTSKKLGMLTADFQSLSFAAENLSNFTEKQFGMALQRMTRRLAEAAAGTGEAKAALKELGVDAQALKLKGPADAFLDIADAIGKVQSKGDQLRLAFKLFDSEGAALVTTLSAGRKEIERYQKLAQDLGLTLSEIDAASVEDAARAMTQAATAFKAMGIQATLAVAPSVTQGLDDMTLATRRGAMGWLEFGGKLVQPVVYFAELIDRGNAVKGMLNEQKGALDEASAATARHAEQLKADIKELDRLQKLADKITERGKSPWQKYREDAKELMDLRGRLLISEKDFIREYAALKKKFEEAIPVPEKTGVAGAFGLAVTTKMTVEAIKAEMALRKEKDKLRESTLKSIAAERKSLLARGAHTVSTFKGTLADIQKTHERQRTLRRLERLDERERVLRATRPVDAGAIPKDPKEERREEAKLRLLKDIAKHTSRPAVRLNEVGLWSDTGVSH